MEEVLFLMLVKLFLAVNHNMLNNIVFMNLTSTSTVCAPCKMSCLPDNTMNSPNITEEKWHSSETDDIK